MGTVTRDRISDLPDEILVLILSLLELKEAARTSVLAWRWRNLWSHTTTLSFDYSDEKFDSIAAMFQLMKCQRLIKDGKLPLVKRPQFVAWVNKLLSLHQGLTIDEFAVSCKLYGRIRKQLIDEWLAFALRKQVKRLKLDFKGDASSWFGNYSLTKPLLHKYNIDNLTVLCLKKVEVTGKVLQYILFKCHHLEVLRVESSYSLVKLKVPGPLPQLKCVAIKNCWKMKYLEICATNIESFTYHGSNIPVTFKEVPCLVEASVGGSYASFFAASIGQFSSYISRLVSLGLNLEHFVKYLTDEALPEFPILENLRQLELVLGQIGVENIMNCCASLLKKCPVLERLLLKTFANRDPIIWNNWRMEREVECLHSHVSVLEFISFHGDKYEVFIACSVVSRLPSLKRVILRPFFSTIFTERMVQIQRNVTECAERLHTIMPHAAELVILW